jgi:hypothetical protein
MSLRIDCYIFFKVKEPLLKCAALFSDLKLPTEAEFKTLEELVAALRPVEILTSKLCRENFNVLQVISRTVL